MKPPFVLKPLLAGACCLASAVSSLFAVNVTVSEDAYVRSGTHANTNFGSATTLDLKKSASATDDFNREIYLKFDLSGITSVQTATLQLYGSETTPQTITAELLSSTNTSWTQAGITWNNKPAVGPIVWSTATIQSTAGWHSWDITRFLQGEKVMGRNLVTLVIRSTVASTTGNITFNSLQNSTNRPRLAITEAHPWTYYEAEAGALANGAAVNTGAQWGDVAFEARGRKAVTLADNNDTVTWTNVKAASHATVRYSLADGQTSSVGLYVNGVKRNVLSLTAVRMRESKTGSDTPVGGIVRFFDDVLVAVAAGIPAGATVHLQKESSDGVACVIDFLEVETAPGAGSKPDSTWVEVVKNTGNDRQAIQAAVDAANAGSKKVWIPAGDYTIDAPPSGDIAVAVPGDITIRGAGMWHTRLTKNFGGTNKRLFNLNGHGVTIQDLKLIDTITTLSNNPGNCVIRVAGGTNNHVVERCWSEYATLVLAFDSNNNIVRNNRARNAYKDCIHFAESSSNNTIEKNFIRNGGDDGVAFIPYDEEEAFSNNVAQYNVVECAYWGRGITIGGGSDNTVRYNVINDCSRAGILVTVETYNTRTTDYCYDFVANRNVVVRCGNQRFHGSCAAVSVFAHVDRPMRGQIQENLILGSTHDASRFDGPVGDPGADVVYFRYNGIQQPTTSGFVRIKDATGTNTDNLVLTPNFDL